MGKKKPIIISPSGNLYGSERVLLDFLKTSHKSYNVFVPAGSALYKESLNLSHHTVIGFKDNSLKFFYLKLIIFIFRNRINTIYINEGGHIKYIKLLARIFKHKKILIHIRILEDTKKQRMGSLKKNMTLITISEYMLSELSQNGYSNIIKLNDPYRFSNISTRSKKSTKELSISVIGRFSKTKGSELVSQFFSEIDSQLNYIISLNLIGNIDATPETKSVLDKLKKLKNIQVNTPGFVANPSDIYNGSDVIMHFSLKEPLGRIYLEAIAHLVPFIGFKSGGIYEIGKNCGLDNYLVEYNGSWVNEMFLILNHLKDNNYNKSEDLHIAREKAKSNYSPETYTKKLEEQLH